MFHVFALTYTYYNLLRCVTHEYSMTSVLEWYMKHVFVAGLVTGDFYKRVLLYCMYYTCVNGKAGRLMGTVFDFMYV